MKWEILSWLFLFLGTFCVAHANQDAVMAVTRANNVFSTQLYDVIRKEKKDNLVVSPLSVSTAVAMLQAGARGETATAIRSSFHFPADDQLNAGYQSLMKELRRDGNITLEMVNRIYPAEGFQLNPQFSSILKNFFGAEPHQINYAKNVEAAEQINSFVSQSTHGKIRDLVEAKDFNDLTRLVIINAIYFKGNWQNPFPKKDTSKMDFYTSETAAVKVDMMQLETDMLYGAIPELDAKAVSLPYEGGRWSMMVLLPNKRTGLAEMEEKLKSFPLDKIVGFLNSKKVQLYLPKFKLESTIDLQKPLTELGVGVIFDAVRANLTGIAAPGQTVGNLFVTKAVQKAFIEVNEEGSEAAASTVIEMGVGSSMFAEPEPIVRVDHPFYSMIVYQETAGFTNAQTNIVFAQLLEMGPGASMFPRPEPKHVVSADHPFYSMIVYEEIMKGTGGQKNVVFAQRIALV